ncbi:unnamed protein product [Nezara viridula]|uniref:Arrestin C-terminal-like domain-containing protein n=1 Tax=Nezara viridula TaxID=85310 RepID=A0A9P0HI81_NEZVI|nr:unnamed protein product [Nezara viridula]
MKDDSEQTKNILTESTPMDYRGAGEGNVEVEFNLVLKPTSPTSLCSSLGGIRYCIVSTVVYSENDSLHIAEASEPISVNQPFQLPEDCSKRVVSTIERAGVVCCIRTITAELGVSSAFLLSGQEAMISGSVMNDTNSSIRGITVNLVQSLQRQKDSKKIKRNVFSFEKGAILPGKRQSWLSEYVILPSLPPSSSNPYFKIWYTLVMEIQKASGKLIKLKIPITICNTPANKVSIPALNSGDVKFEWKKTETQDVSSEYAPLYVTHVP